jgi:hypothetical protein
MLSVMVLLLMMAAIFWPAYRVTRPAAAAPTHVDRPTITHPSRRTTDQRTPAREEPAMLVSRLDDYVQQGLVDLRIMLVQSARRQERQDRG